MTRSSTAHESVRAAAARRQARGTDLPPAPRPSGPPASGGDAARVVIEGEASLLERFREPLLRALTGRPAFYRVGVDWVGRCGAVMISVTGSKGRLPLLFDRQELEPGYVSMIVRSTVEKYAL